MRNGITRILLIISSSMVFLASPLLAGSIFDDNYVPPPSKSPPPSQPPPAPKPAPADPPASTNKPAPTSAPAPAPVHEVSAPSVSLPDPKAIEIARKKAEENLLAVKAQAEARVAQDPAYKKAKLAADTARKKWTDIRENGSLAEKADLLEKVSEADASAAALFRRLLDADKDYQAAKKTLAQYPAPVIAATMPSKPTSESTSLASEIAKAIAQHRLIPGMSFKEARASAQRPYETVSTSTDTKVYRWIIKGAINPRTVVRVDQRGRRYNETVSDYGIVAYVEGTFVDDKLSTYRRYAAK